MIKRLEAMYSKENCATRGRHDLSKKNVVEAATQCLDHGDDDDEVDDEACTQVFENMDEGSHDDSARLRIPRTTPPRDAEVTEEDETNRGWTEAPTQVYEAGAALSGQVLRRGDVRRLL